MLAAPSFTVTAAETYPCHGCTPEQVADKAWETLSWAGSGYAFYLDYVNGKAYRFANIAPIPDHTNPEPEPYYPDIVIQPIDPDIVKFADDMRILTNGNTLTIYSPPDDIVPQASMKATLNAAKATAASDEPTQLPGNAYELMRRTDLQANLADYILTTDRGMTGYVIQSMGFISAKGVDLSKVPAVVTYQFRDGSKALFKLDISIQRYVRVPDQAFDSHGNQIPENKDQFLGHNYPLGSTGEAYDYNYLSERATMFGYDVNVVYKSGIQSYMTCTPDGCIVYIQLQ